MDGSDTNDNVRWIKENGRMPEANRSTGTLNMSSNGFKVSEQKLQYNFF